MYLKAGALGILLVLLAACGGGADSTANLSSPTPSLDLAVTTPEAAGQSGMGVLDEILALSAGFEQVAIWGRGEGGVRFEAPNGVTLDTNGDIYVTEFQGGHVRKFSAAGELLLEVAGAGTEPGMLANPIGVAVHPDGSIYVSEAGASRVSRFASDGTFLSTWGESGSTPGTFRSAMGIAVTDDEVFVADFGNHRIQVFDLVGTFLREWGGQGKEPGQFDNPIGLQVGPAGNVWVVDSVNERVQVFTPQGDIVQIFEDVGSGPQIVSVNRSGEFYVSSPWADGRVRRFTPDGELIGYIGDSITDEEFGRMTSTEIERMLELSPLAGPHGTVTDSEGAVYVADTGNNIVRKFSPTGE